ncbi:T9SS type A sorting domain-containing protein [Psychroserpens sp.]|uniref:T9SS type A sorting domain-containing protein n=1 Tax=Psychroserpens sp. TaxID=2020870 RepID=UPI00385E4C50
MKQLYLIFFLLFTSFSIAQNDLLGEWYLDYFEIDNSIYTNNYNNESLFLLDISQFDGGENQLSFNGFGSCNAFEGLTDFDDNELIFNDLNFTLAECTFTPGVIFEDLYFYSFLNPGQDIPFNLSYTIIGNNEDQILTITNPLNGNLAVYGRSPNPEILNRTWYLSRIEIPGNPVIQIPGSESPSLTITNDINPITFKGIAFGEGECNSFMSDYEVTLNNGNNIKLFDFSPTLGFCQSSYEDEYFITLGDPTNNFSEFEITNNGSTLSMTDLLGGKLIFGDEPLSVSENDFNTLNISLKNNPVIDKLELLLNANENKLFYTLYTLEGKLVQEARLSSEYISVEGLNSGLYFIRFTNSANQKQTIKFIKQ